MSYQIITKNDMESENARLTMDFIKSLMDDSYTLVWVDWRDNLDDSRDLIRKCLDSRSCEQLWDMTDGWYSDAECAAIREIVAGLKGKCVNIFNKDDVDAFFNEHADEIIDEIYNRNGSDILGELLKNSDDIPVRIEMLSNYDCINSNWFESHGGYSYGESYFGDMVDALNLNPAKVKRLLTEHGYRTYGRFPDRRGRNGKEQVSYGQFYRELVNSCSGANLLTYMGKVKLKELYDAGFSLKEVVIPKGNRCGLFSSTFGGGSLLEMELTRDVKLKLEVRDYHGFRLRLDDGDSGHDCSIRQVYGVDDSFFGDAVSLVPAMNNISTTKS